jgi:putative restriction endonuclease
MRQLIERRRKQVSPIEDYQIGVILLQKPFFFSKEDWIPIPADFSKNIVQGKTYDLSFGYGKELWKEIQLRLQARNFFKAERISIQEPKERYGEPILINPRLGQGSFRVVVTDVYQRQCAVTHEKVLPALEAAHIKPFSQGGDHAVSNGILLRSDVHKLFDKGYVTVTPDHHFEVSRKVKEDFDNGRHYYAFHGAQIYIPLKSDLQPSHEYLSWHNENVFKG